ncbi:jg1862 [Pararge aegeria aegeria]|uniref:Jg1862 protein n=1 Tax=Pararge aegeria aegeria TaxID=348720 RepID=A0A8S4R0N3_9NEOP|nr:jg1862 [Pararge aegeria aegeria]
MVTSWDCVCGASAAGTAGAVVKVKRSLDEAGERAGPQCRVQNTGTFSSTEFGTQNEQHKIHFTLKLSFDTTPLRLRARKVRVLDFLNKLTTPELRSLRHQKQT